LALKLVVVGCTPNAQEFYSGTDCTSNTTHHKTSVSPSQHNKLTTIRLANISLFQKFNLKATETQARQLCKYTAPPSRIAK
jgi:hypothetical protein